MKYFTDELAEQLQREADARQEHIESLLAEMEIPQSTLDEKINYEQYLFIKSISNSAVKYDYLDCYAKTTKERLT